MDVVEFAKQVKMMRDCQNEYFANRTQTNLFNAKQQERYVDDLTEGVLNPDAPITQLNMFKVEDLSVKFEEVPQNGYLFDSHFDIRDKETQFLIAVYGSMKTQGEPILFMLRGPSAGKVFVIPVGEIRKFAERLMK